MARSSADKQHQDPLLKKQAFSHVLTCMCSYSHTLENIKDVGVVVVDMEFIRVFIK